MNDLLVENITQKDVRHYWDYMRNNYVPQPISDNKNPLSPKFIRNIWGILSSFCTWASVEFQLPNPMDQVPAHRYKLPPIEPYKTVSIPSKSILLKIDQKASVVSKREFYALLSVFLKVFNKMRCHYGVVPYITEFKRGLDHRGEYAATFKMAYQRIVGKPWEESCKEANLEFENIASALAESSDMQMETAINSLDDYLDDIRLFIEGFAEQVNEYIQTQEPGLQRNFFVDEIEQFIANNTKLLTNLQTIAKSLATLCKGQSSSL